MGKLMTNEYARLLAEVRERVRPAQYAAFRAVNKELIALYWDIGRMISKRQVTGMHGDAVVEQLATDLRMEFPGVGGFSRRNVFYMQEFYIARRDLPKGQPLVAQIRWTQNLIVLQACKRQADGTSWGKAVVERLAADLRAEFPGIQGFSSQNFWYMRQFYLAYYGHEKLQPLVGEISWAKHLVILGKCKDPLEREFYIRMTRKFGWTKNVLIHQIENQSYEKTPLGQTDFDKALTPKL